MRRGDRGRRVELDEYKMDRMIRAWTGSGEFGEGVCRKDEAGLEEIVFVFGAGERGGIYFDRSRKNIKNFKS